MVSLARVGFSVSTALFTGALLALSLATFLGRLSLERPSRSDPVVRTARLTLPRVSCRASSPLARRRQVSLLQRRHAAEIATGPEPGSGADRVLVQVAD